MKHLLKVVIAASLVICAGCKDPRKDPDVKQKGKDVVDANNAEKFSGKAEKDADFVAKWIESNYKELKIAQLGAEKSSNSQLKKIANMLQTSHTKTLNELKTLAQAKAISIPVEESSDAKDHLQKLTDSGRNFDREWCEEVKDYHEDAIDELESRRDKTEDPEIKAWIDKEISEMRAHLEQIKVCEQRMKETANN